MMAFLGEVTEVQVTEYQMLCGSNRPVLFPLESLSESILTENHLTLWLNS